MSKWQSDNFEVRKIQGEFLEIMSGNEELNECVPYLSELAVECFEAVLNNKDGDVQKLEGLRNCKVRINNLQEAVENDVFSRAFSEMQEQIDKNIDKLLLPEPRPPTKKIRTDCDLKLNAQDERVKILDIIKETQVAPMVTGFSEIAGLEDIKSTLERLLILPVKQPQLYTNLKTGNCILLYGPPGTGKTKIVHALASEANVQLHCVGASTILSSFVGQTEKTLRELFHYMKSSPGRKILFIDEIDGLCRQRAQNELEHTRRLKTELMGQLTYFGEYPDAFLICATNCPWDLDVAFMRRFQEKLYIPLPDYEQRFDLLKLYTKNTSLEQTYQNWEALLRSTEGFSGSDLNDLVQHGLRMPIIKLQMARAWQKLGDKYEPINFESNFKFNSTAEYIFCGIKDLPENSVLMEKGDVCDLYEALKIIKRTVSEAEIKRYNEYVQN